MRRESSLGRALWIALVVVLGGYVVADFVRSPFVASSGSAAVRPAELTLWTPAGEADGETAPVVEGAAAALDLAGHETTTKRLVGGSSESVAEFLSRPPRGGANLLVVTSATLADLAHDHRDSLVPGAAEEAAFARQLLARATPIALLASDPLALGVERFSGAATGATLLASVRNAPGTNTFGIADDTWSRVELASLVNRAGVNGHVPFSVYQSAAAAGQAAQQGAVSAVLAPRGSLKEEFDPGHLRRLAWPFAPTSPPRFWIGLVAPPGTPHDQARTLRAAVASLDHNQPWEAQLRQLGRDPGTGGSTHLAEFLQAGSVRADRMELLAQRVERR